MRFTACRIVSVGINGTSLKKNVIQAPAPLKCAIASTRVENLSENVKNLSPNE